MINVFVLVLLIFISNSFEVEILTPESKHIEGYWLRLGTQQENITGRVVLAEPYRGCEDYTNRDEVEGNIVLVAPHHCSPQDKVKYAQRAGAIGVLVTCYKGYKGGMVSYYGDAREHPELKIRALEIWKESAEELKALIEQNPNVTVLMSSDLNPWKKIYEGANWLAFSIIFGVFHVAAFFWAGLRIYLKVWNEGLKLSLPIIILGMEMAACVARIVVLLDPGYTRNIIPYALSYGIFTLNFSLSLGATLVIAFYWRKVSNSLKLNIVPSLKKMRVPTIVIIVVMLLFQVIDLIIRYSWINNDIHIMLLGMTYFLICFGVGVFFVITARKLFKVINGGLDARKRDNPVLKKMKIFMIVNTIGLFCFLVVPGGIGATQFSPAPLFDIPEGQAFLTWMAYIAMTIITFSHIAVFSYGSDAKSSGSSTFSRKKNSKSDSGKQPTATESLELTNVSAQ